MSFNKAFWSVFRVSYLVTLVFWVGVLVVRAFPPEDGNYAREFGGSLAINTLTLVVWWAFVPEERLLCWLGWHEWATECVVGMLGDKFCVREKCLAGKSLMTGRVYRRASLFGKSVPKV